MELLPGRGSTLKFILKIENRIQELIGHIKAVRERVIGTHLQLKRRFCASAASKADTSRLNRRVKERERKKRRRKENTARSHIINTVCTISKVSAVEIETALDDNKKKNPVINLKNITDSAVALKLIKNNNIVAAEALPIINEWISMLEEKKEQTTQRNLAKKIKQEKTSQTGIKQFWYHLPQLC